MRYRDLGLALAVFLAVGSVAGIMLPVPLSIDTIFALWMVSIVGVALGVLVSLADALLAPTPGKVLMSVGWLLGLLTVVAYYPLPSYSGKAAVFLLVGGAVVRGLEPTGVIPYA